MVASIPPASIDLSTAGLLHPTTTKNVARPVECYEIYYGDQFGSPDIRLVSAETSIRFEGKLYSPVEVQREAIRMSTSEMIDGVNIGIDNAGRSITKFFQERQLKGTRAVIRKVYRPTPNRAESKIIFDGRIQTVSFSEQSIQLQVDSILEAFNTQFPKRLFQTRCTLLWGEDACGIDIERPQHNHQGFAMRGSTSQRILDPTLRGYASGYWDAGYVKMLDGPDAEVVRPVARYDPEKGMLVLRVPFDNTTFEQHYRLRRGCKRTKEDCEDRYNNLPLYAGFAEIPSKPTLK